MEKNKQPRIIINCQECENGLIGFGEDQIICPKCEGRGCLVVSRDDYDQQLIREQKNRKETGGLS